MQTQHSDTTFKHVLLPLWSAAFQFRDKTYRFVVNGRNGKTRGERPYSIIKIACAVVIGVSAAGSGMFFANQAGVFDSAGSSFWVLESFDSRRPASPEWRDGSLQERRDYRF